MAAPGSPPTQPSEHRGWCDCPVLAAQAEIQRLATMGMVLEGYDSARAYVIAALRERHGCHGMQPGYGFCHWDMAISHASARLQTDPNVPAIKGSSDGKSGVYL